nr:MULTISPECIES: nitroreductase family protein [unclassified Ornithinimicrobium]
MPVLRQRWSPRQFDPGHEMAPEQVEALLEAARWAPSAGNSQPWAFHVVLRDGVGWDAVLGAVAGSSRPWATQASMLVVNLAHVQVEDTDWEFSEFSVYDLGQAVAHMTIQAHAMGLGCRQFRAFDKEVLTAELAVTAHWEILTMTAVGAVPVGADRGPGAGVREPDITWPRP